MSCSAACVSSSHLATLALSVLTALALILAGREQFVRWRGPDKEVDSEAADVLSESAATASTGRRKHIVSVQRICDGPHGSRRNRMFESVRKVAMFEA